MRNNLLRKEIEFISTEDLNIRYCYILDRAEKSEAKDIPIADAREILWIEEILHSRLIKQLGRDPYPPDRIEKKYPSNYMISIMKPDKPKVAESELETGNKIKMKVTIKSSIGSKVAEFNVEVDSRSEADLRALEEIRKLGLKKATYKLS